MDAPYMPARRKRRALARRRARRQLAGGVLALATASAAAFFMFHAAVSRRPAVTLSLPAPVPMSLSAVPGSAIVLNPGVPLTVTDVRVHGLPITLVSGGTVGTRRVAHRVGVPQFVADAGAQAGLNGTYFADAALRGTDNVLIGPTLCGDEGRMTRGPYDRGPLLSGRPLVLLAPTQTRIVPYNPATMDTDAALRRLLPGVTDAFLAGVWLVHDGQAADKAGVAAFHVKDADDPRRRAFFALGPDGAPVLGATTDVTGATRLASALSAAGVREAVLMDSGFSTSLVDGERILVTGHTAPQIPSRPVPHAVLLFAPGQFTLSPLVAHIVMGTNPSPSLPEMGRVTERLSRTPLPPRTGEPGRREGAGVFSIYQYTAPNPVSNDWPNWPIPNGSLSGNAFSLRLNVTVEPGRRPPGVS